MAGVSLRHLFKKYADGVVAVSDFCLEIEDGEFIVLVGPSGCGKSTTLRMIAGLEEISGGEIYIGDRLINDVPSKDMDIAMVFQSYALYPHLTVYDNMAFGLKLRQTPNDEIKRAVEEAAQILDISHLLGRKPTSLSGGQRQRVALGRAIVREPKVLLFDEPLSNLDAKLRAHMRTELSKLHKKLGTTFIYVTHDQTEAMMIGERIVVMNDGTVQQVDTPQNLYERPCNVFVAGFMGSPQMNFIDAKLKITDGGVFVQFGTGCSGSTGKVYEIKLPGGKTLNDEIKIYDGKDIILGIRPENIHDEEMILLGAAGNIVDAHVEDTELMDAEAYLYLDIDGVPVIARVSPLTAAKPGDDIKIAFEIKKIHLFGKETEKVIIN